MRAQELITEHLDLWTGAVTHKSNAGRGNNGKVELTGIKKLRELILELAVRGKLVENVNGETWICIEIGELIAKRLPTISPDELDNNTYELWSVPAYSNGYPEILKGHELGSSKKAIPKNSVLLSKINPHLNRVWKVSPVSENQLAASPEWIALSPEGDWDRDYLVISLMAPRFNRELCDTAQGMGSLTRANIKQTSKLKISKPSLCMQRSIAEKVGELMALCDRLEQQVGNQLEAHEVLVDTLLDVLARSMDAAELVENWARIAEHFDSLFTTEASIDKLKQTILQLAVTGRLTEQNQEDVPARFAYGKKITLPENYNRKTKQKIKERPITSLEELPVIPPSWAYFKIDELYASNHILDYADGNHGSLYPRKGDFGDEGVLFLTATQITDGGEIMWGNCPRLSYRKANKLSKGWSQKGDVLFTHNATVGRTGLASSPPENDFLLGTSVTFYRVNGESVNRGYLHYYFASPLWQNQAAAIMKQTTRNQVSITKQALFYVSLPPLNEQRRVVERVHATMALCDQLKARLGEAGETHVQLAEAVVEQAV